MDFLTTTDLNANALVFLPYVLVFFLLLLFIFHLQNRKVYRCNKCGFETLSADEAAGHEKLENMHKAQ